MFLVKFQDCHESALRYFDRTDLAHPLLTLLLLLEELSLTADITTVTLRGHILSDSLHSLAGDDLCSDRSLDRDVELLTRDELLVLLTHLSAEVIRVVSMDERRKGVGRIAVEKNIKLHKLRILEADHMIVKRSISL